MNCRVGIGLVLVLNLLMAGVVGLACGQETSVRPGINKTYADPNVKDAIHRFEGESREIFQKREAIVAACGIRPGMAVADIGAGTGLFTRLFAPQVGPTGKVYAVDIAKKFIDHIEETCREQKLSQVVGIVCTSTSTELPADSIDLAFVCDTYHHFEYPFKTLASIHKALRPGGRLVVIDYRKEKGVSSDWTMNHIRADQKTVAEEVCRAGFRLLDEPPLLKDQYMLRFKRQ